MKTARSCHGCVRGAPRLAGCVTLACTSTRLPHRFAAWYTDLLHAVALQGYRQRAAGTGVMLVPMRREGAWASGWRESAPPKARDPLLLKRG